MFNALRVSVLHNHHTLATDLSVACLPGSTRKELIEPESFVQTLLSRVSFAALLQATVMIETPQEYFFESEGCYITELSNSDVDLDLSIAKARVTPGVTTAWHRLNNTTERYCILSGVGRVEVGDDVPREVNTGDVVIIPPMQRQRITNIGTEDLIFLALCTPRFVFENYQQLT